MGDVTLEQIAEFKNNEVSSVLAREILALRRMVLDKHREDIRMDDKVYKRLDALEDGRANGEPDLVMEAQLLKRAERAERDNAQLAERLARTTETCQGQIKRAIRLDGALRKIEEALHEYDQGSVTCHCPGCTARRIAQQALDGDAS
jgi:hypothetical protein